MNLALMIAAIILAAYIIISGGNFMSVASIAAALIAVIAASRLFCYLYTKSGSKFEFFHKKC